MTDSKDIYAKRKNAQYEHGASQWSVDYRDAVVGSFDAQNNWKDYDEPHKDTRIESPNEIKSDLEKIGFSNFDYDIRPVGPGDSHSSWIFFRAKK
jgi:hypothetical protein